MYKSQRKIFGYDDDCFEMSKQSDQKFRRRPVIFKTAALNELTETEDLKWSNADEPETTTMWSIIHGFDRYGYYRLLVPPGTILCDIERPPNYPNYVPYIPTKSNIQKSEVVV